jgi:histidinol-phosphate aminotransferase
MTVSFTRTLTSLDISSPFLGPTELERRRGRPYKARLGANEGLFGASPVALEALRSHGAQVSLYADPGHRRLRQRIATSWRLRPENVLFAGGIEGLLDLFVRAFIEPGDVAVTSHGAFIGFDYFLCGYGGRLVHVPYTSSYTNDLEGLLEAVQRHAAKLLYLANPDNPTGTLIPPQRIEQRLDRLPATCVLLLDEAYAEYAGESELLPTTRMAPNLVRLRSLSKAYGLAGARVGYACGDSSLLGPLDRIRIHFALSGPAQEMALAALEDRAFLAEVVEKTREGREHYAAIARAANLRTVPSAANFVALEFASPGLAAAAAVQLEEHDVFVVRPSAPPLDRLVRVTVGPPAARALLSSAVSHPCDALATGHASP